MAVEATIGPTPGIVWEAAERLREGHLLLGQRGLERRDLLPRTAPERSVLLDVRPHVAVLCQCREDFSPAALAPEAPAQPSPPPYLAARPRGRKIVGPPLC